MGSKGRKKKKEGDKEDLSVLHNGARDCESGFVAACPPSPVLPARPPVALASNPDKGRRRFRGCFATGSALAASFLFFNPFYKRPFAGIPKAARAVPTLCPTDSVPQLCPGTGGQCPPPLPPAPPYTK